MPGKRMTPDQEIEATTLREAGYSLTLIAERVGVSVSSLQRLFKRRSVRKGAVTEEAVQSAREGLLHAMSTNDSLKEEMARIISDDLAHSRLIREKAAIAAESLEPSDTAEAALAMRALVAYSTLLKNTSDTIRQDLKSTGFEGHEMDDSLPELIIRGMTPEEIKAVEEEQQRRLVA